MFSNITPKFPDSDPHKKNLANFCVFNGSDYTGIAPIELDISENKDLINYFENLSCPAKVKIINEKYEELKCDFLEYDNFKESLISRDYRILFVDNVSSWSISTYSLVEILRTEEEPPQNPNKR